MVQWVGTNHSRMRSGSNSFIKAYTKGLYNEGFYKWVKIKFPRGDLHRNQWVEFVSVRNHIDNSSKLSEFRYVYPN